MSRLRLLSGRSNRVSPARVAATSLLDMVCCAWVVGVVRGRAGRKKAVHSECRRGERAKEQGVQPISARSGRGRHSHTSATTYCPWPSSSSSSRPWWSASMADGWPTRTHSLLAAHSWEPWWWGAGFTTSRSSRTSSSHIRRNGACVGVRTVALTV